MAIMGEGIPERLPVSAGERTAAVDDPVIRALQATRRAEMSRTRQHPVLVNEQLATASPGLRQALAWWIAAELVRRHPRALRILGSEDHHGPALNICATPNSSGRPASNGIFIPMSWNFVIAVSGTQETQWIGGVEALLVSDRRTAIVKRLELASGLPSPAQTPRTTDDTIGPRVIAAFLQRTSLERSGWWMSNGAPIDDDGCGIQHALFEAFPGLAREMYRQKRADLSDHMESRYWFLRPLDGEEPGKPLVAIDTTSGLAWRVSGPLSLMSKYRELKSSLDRLVSAVMPPAL